eukprot:COSAG05_NODE_11_length_38500_cov_831.349861_43_plen_365_part_00
MIFITSTWFLDVLVLVNSALYLLLADSPEPDTEEAVQQNEPEVSNAHSQGQQQQQHSQYRSPSPPGASMPEGTSHTMLLLVYGLVILFPVWSLCGYHGYLIAQGETTKERLMSSRSKASADEENAGGGSRSQGRAALDSAGLAQDAVAQAKEMNCLQHWLKVCSAPPPSALGDMRRRLDDGLSVPVMPSQLPGAPGSGSVGGNVRGSNPLGSPTSSGGGRGNGGRNSGGAARGGGQTEATTATATTATTTTMNAVAGAEPDSEMLRQAGAGSGVYPAQQQQQQQQQQMQQQQQQQQQQQMQQQQMQQQQMQQQQMQQQNSSQSAGGWDGSPRRHRRPGVRDTGWTAEAPRGSGTATAAAAGVQG